MNKITNTSELKLGLWASQCCHCDLHEIKTEEEIAEIIGDWEEGISYDVYNSKKEALLDIRKGFGDLKTLNEIDKMIGEDNESKFKP